MPRPEVKAGQYVMIAVTDTGAGMSPDMMAKAFEPVFTTKPSAKGTGLGLSQVRLRQAIRWARQNLFGAGRRHDDQDLSSALHRYRGSGTVGQGGRQDRCPGNRTVLLVEDDARVRASTAATLLELGYTVIEAAGGEEGLRKLGEHPTIALMLTDIVMPVMNGRHLAEQAAAVPAR